MVRRGVHGGGGDDQSRISRFVDTDYARTRDRRFFRMQLVCVQNSRVERI